MRTTISLDPEAYKLARAVAFQKHESLGKVLGDAILRQFRTEKPKSPSFRIDEYGFPVIHIGQPITPEEVAAAIEGE